MELRIRPYVTNSRLPEFLRIPSGAIETLVNKGLCDNASRRLAFILKQKGYDSVQWNMVTSAAAHSALLVFLHDGRKVFVDPFYGYLAIDRQSQKLMSLPEAKKHVSSGRSLNSVLTPIDREHSFYSRLHTMFMAAEGDNLVIRAELPSTTAPLYLGAINGQDSDVKNAASQAEMTPFWHYMGHRYNREWVRVLSAKQRVRLEITLVSDVQAGVDTATPRPQVNGKKMTWHLNPGDEIKFTDATATISWRRLNSYTGVDQIAIYPE
jgi:hypothetical protein